MAHAMQSGLLHILDAHVLPSVTTVRFIKAWFTTQTKRILRHEARAHDFLCAH